MPTADALKLNIGDTVRVGRSTYTAEELLGLDGKMINSMRSGELNYDSCPRVEVLSRDTQRGTTVRYLDDMVPIVDGQQAKNSVYGVSAGAVRQIHSGFIGFVRDQERQCNLSDRTVQE